MRTPAAVLVLLWSFVLTQPAQGADELTPQDLRTLSKTRAKQKKQVFIQKNLKFLKFFPPTKELKVWGGRKGKQNLDSPLPGHLIVLRKDVRDRLKRGTPVDHRGKKLWSKRSNLKVFGYTDWDSRSKKPILVVEKVLRLPSLREHYTRRHKRLDPSSQDPIKDREDLRDEIRHMTRSYPNDRKELTPLLRLLKKEVSQIRIRSLPALPGGAKARLALANDKKVTTELAILLASQVWAHPEVSRGSRLQAEQVLGRRKARLHLGKWYDESQFMNKIDFARASPEKEFGRICDRVHAGSSWVPQPLVDLVSASLREKKRKRGDSAGTDEILKQVAERGSIKQGMTKQMVQIACNKKIGPDGMFPLRVERFREKIKGIDHLWELWVMKTGLRIYFLQNRVFETVPK